MAWRDTTLGLLILQGHDHIKPLLGPHDARDMALAGQIFSQKHVTRTDALDGTIPNLDFRFPS